MRKSCGVAPFGGGVQHCVEERWQLASSIYPVTSPIFYAIGCFIGIGGVVAACSACNRKVVGLNPGSALPIPEVNVVDIQLRAL